jgi:hypothetical protein
MYQNRISRSAGLFAALVLVVSGAHTPSAQPSTGSDKNFTSADQIEQLKNVMERWEKLKKDNDALQLDFQKIKQMESRKDEWAAAVTAAKAGLDREQAKSGGNGPYTAVKKGYEDVVGGRKQFQTYEEAAQFADGGKITDREGKTVTGPPTPPDPAALRKAQDDYDKARLAYDQQSATFESRKADYDKKRDKVDQDLKLIEKMIKDLGGDKGGKIGPKYTLTYDESVPKDKLHDPKYPYRVSSSELKDVVGKSVGVGPDQLNRGQCAALVQQYSKVGETKDWRKGEAVKGANDIPAGTAIATFNDKGRYANAATGNHAALYIKQDKNGIYVLDQYFYTDPKTHEKKHKDAGVRLIRFISEEEKARMLKDPKRYGTYSPSNDANAYSVITHVSDTPLP